MDVSIRVSMDDFNKVLNNKLLQFLAIESHVFEG